MSDARTLGRVAEDAWMAAFHSGDDDLVNRCWEIAAEAVVAAVREQEMALTRAINADRRNRQVKS